MKLTVAELFFLKTALKYGEQDYKDRAVKYFDMDGYRQNVYLPTLKTYQTINQKISNEKKRLKKK